MSKDPTKFKDARETKTKVVRNPHQVEFRYAENYGHTAAEIIEILKRLPPDAVAFDADDGIDSGWVEENTCVIWFEEKKSVPDGPREGVNTVCEATELPIRRYESVFEMLGTMGDEEAAAWISDKRSAKVALLECMNKAERLDEVVAECQKLRLQADKALGFGCNLGKEDIRAYERQFRIVQTVIAMAKGESDE